MNLFVWDFHGVLEMGTEYGVIEISNIILQRFGYEERFTEDDVNKMYGLKWWEYFKHLLPHESQERHLELQAACFSLSMSDRSYVAKHIKPTPHSHTVLQQIQQSGSDQIVISNTQPESLPWFLQAVNIAHFFPDGNFFASGSHKNSIGKAKKDLLNEYTEGKEYKKIIIIGDSAHDIDLTPTGGISYLYAHPGKPFPLTQAHYKINDLREILKELKD